MKLYAERDIMALGQRYCDHVNQMTAEDLHGKSEIAAELAWRDWIIECEQDARARIAHELSIYREALQKIAGSAWVGFHVEQRLAAEKVVGRYAGFTFIEDAKVRPGTFELHHPPHADREK